MGQPVIGSILESFLELAKSFFQPSLLLVERSQVIVSLSVIRVDLQRLLKGSLCFLFFTLLEEEDRVVVMDICLVGIQIERRTVVLHRLIQLTQPTVKGDEIDVGLHQLGVDLQRPLMFTNRLVDFACLLENGAPTNVRNRSQVEFTDSEPQWVI